MKVLGSGSPLMLTVRLKSCEVSVWDGVLCRRRSEAVAAAGMEPAAFALPGNMEAEGPHEEMFVLARLLDDLHRSPAEGQARELIGPTWLLDPVIRDAASEAVERLSDAVDVFRADTGTLSSDDVRAAVDTAGACTASLIALDFVQNHAVA